MIGQQNFRSMLVMHWGFRKYSVLSHHLGAPRQEPWIPYCNLNWNTWGPVFQFQIIATWELSWGNCQNMEHPFPSLSEPWMYFSSAWWANNSGTKFRACAKKLVLVIGGNRTTWKVVTVRVKSKLHRRTSLHTSETSPVNKLYIKSKCIEVYGEFRTILGHWADQDYIEFID